MVTALSSSTTAVDSPDTKFRKHTVLEVIEGTLFHTSRGSFSTHGISSNVPVTPASCIQPSWYHDMDSVIKNVDQYFLDRWSFPSEKARKRFVSSSFARVACKLANDIVEPTFDFMRAQAEKTRKRIKGMGLYLLYRERDVRNTVLSAVMHFSMDLPLTPEELLLVGPIDKNCSRHITVVNDIFSWEKESWEKELAKSCIGHDEGSFLCFSVKILADEGSLTTEASKRVLFAMVREWELTHCKLAEVIRRDKRVAEDRKGFIVNYIKGLEYQMSGNEYWSARTLRYIGAESL
ncbi:hypothetical protein Hte_001762 [Hypoxylon texense]